MEAINDVMAVRVLSRYVVELTFESGDVRVLDPGTAVERAGLRTADGRLRAVPTGTGGS
jgi:hypothetical protein